MMTKDLNARLSEWKSDQESRFNDFISRDGHSALFWAGQMSTLCHLLLRTSLGYTGDLSWNLERLRYASVRYDEEISKRAPLSS